MDLQSAVNRQVKGARRNMEVFRKGVVMAVDTSVTPWLATINGRKMPFIDEDINAGDIVFYVDQPDPFAWARVLTVVDPEYFGIRGSATYAYNVFFGSTNMHFNETPTGTTTYDSYLLIQLANMPGGLSPYINPNGSYPETPTELFDETIGSGQAMAHYMIEDSVTRKWRLSHGSTKTYYNDEWRIGGVTAVTGFAISHGSPASFPAVASPAVGALHLYGIVHESSGAAGSNGSYEYATGTYNAYATYVPTGLPPRNETTQGSPTEGDLNRAGQVILSYEFSGAAGAMPTRTPTVTPTSGRSYSLFTIACTMEEYVP